MTVRALAPSALLRRGPQGPTAVLDAIGARELVITDARWLAVLEAFAHEALPVDAQRVGTDGLTASAELAADERFQRAHSLLTDGALLVSARGIRVLPHGLAQGEVLTLTRLSARAGGVVPALFDQPIPADAFTSPRFEATVDALVDVGLLAPAPGTLDWGDLRRNDPLCPVFGLGRGTAIDRHYLHTFLADVRPLVTGDVLDVGGQPADRVVHRLGEESSFRILDVEERAGVDVVADVHDAEALPPASVDTVLLLNVLEHCDDPRRVAANVHRWLRPGGHAVVLVPNAQRQHHAAADHWRFSTSGLALVFAAFTAHDLRTYGSFRTVLGSYAGMAAEELTADELAAHQADHPVVTCLVARK